MEREKVTLHGTWASTYPKRVELALKIKGVPYEYVEEDLQNKSQALLEYNPIHRKVPVLVHNGKPLAESLIILGYIDEKWPNHTPRLLPDDPHQRARIRFGASFFDNQNVFNKMVTWKIELMQDKSADEIREMKLFQSHGKGQEEALNELHEKMSLMAQEMGNLIPSDVSSFQNGSLSLLDVQMSLALGVYRAQEEALGKKILDAGKHPLIFSWVTALMELPVIKEHIPPYQASQPSSDVF